MKAGYLAALTGMLAGTEESHISISGLHGSETTGKEEVTNLKYLAICSYKF